MTGITIVDVWSDGLDVALSQLNEYFVDRHSQWMMGIDNELYSSDALVPPMENTVFC